MLVTMRLSTLTKIVVAVVLATFVATLLLVNGDPARPVPGPDPRAARSVAA
ncbi:hypothetical protein [Amycolatopsis sp. RTGN1]|uniref:hypothetical protein n=1 Tax=Amycolatopsis ponsaeliensis TaxID=2992142 RepID=UPI00254B587A|nr:hypothetical protein [Amycolatopsis sp. RTGN1]